MRCVSLKVDISSKPPTQKRTTQRVKKREKKNTNEQVAKSKQNTHTLFTHTHIALVTHTNTALSVPKQLFLSVTQTAPSCFCQCDEKAFKLWNNITRVYRDALIRFTVLSKRKGLGAGEEKKKLLEVFQQCEKECTDKSWNKPSTVLSPDSGRTSVSQAAPASGKTLDVKG